MSDSCCFGRDKFENLDEFEEWQPFMFLMIFFCYLIIIIIIII